MKRSQRQYIVDMIEAMTNARRFVADMTIEELRRDLKTQPAVQR